MFPLGEEVFGFSIKGAKYPLTNHTLIPYDSLCVSNQFQEDEVTDQLPEWNCDSDGNERQIKLYINSCKFLKKWPTLWPINLLIKALMW